MMRNTLPPAEENRTSAQWKGMRRRAIEGEEKEGGGRKRQGEERESSERGGEGGRERI